jgi:Leucine-rich repeat (LRR) protein
MEIKLFYITLCLFLPGNVTGAQPELSCPGPCRCLLFDGLQSVYCNRTGINAVPSGIPTNTQLLDLSDNSIAHITRNDLITLVNLQELYLYGNGLNESSIEDTALDLPKLVTVELSGNGYQTIPKCLPKWIQKLWFINNQLAELKSDSFVKYTELNYLDVSTNHISKIEARTFDPLTKLQTLYISFNKLTDSSFPPNVFAKMSSLELLSTRFNALRHLFRNLPPSIKYLDYVGNEIKTIPSYAFKSLPNLQAMEFWQGQVSVLVLLFFQVRKLQC